MARRRRGTSLVRGAVAPPRGRLFQQDLTDDPFYMLVACSLVNLTTWEVAERAHRWLRATYPTPYQLALASPDALVDIMRPLGLWRRRSRSVVAMAKSWSSRRPTCAKDVEELPGCGAYASASWAIFVDGRSDVETGDGKLRWYLEASRESIVV